MRDSWRTDKPPEEREKYLVQLQAPVGYMMICEWSNTYYFTNEVMGEWHWKGLPQYVQQSDVIAWKLLPEPYAPKNQQKSIIFDEDTADCPTCGFTFEQFKTPWGAQYCPQCGQRLYWEDYES